MANEIQVLIDGVVINDGDGSGEFYSRLASEAKITYRDKFPQTSDWVPVTCGETANGTKFTISCCYAPSPFQSTKLFERYT